MTQIVENWTCVVGEITEVTAAAMQTRATIGLRIHRSSDVKGFQNLFHEEPGATIKIAMPEGFDSEAAALKGRTITLPLRAAKRGTYFAHPEWSLEKGSSLCSEPKRFRR